MITIYRIHNPDGLSYIGSTVQKIIGKYKTQTELACLINKRADTARRIERNKLIKYHGIYEFGRIS